MSYFQDNSSFQNYTENDITISGIINTGIYKSTPNNLSNGNYSQLLLTENSHLESNIRGEVNMNNQISGSSTETTNNLINSNIGIVKDDIIIVNTDINNSNIQYSQINTNVTLYNNNLIESNINLHFIDNVYDSILDTSNIVVPDISNIKIDIDKSNLSIYNINLNFDSINTEAGGIYTSYNFSNSSISTIETNIDNINTLFSYIDSNISESKSNISFMTPNIEVIKNTVKTSNITVGTEDLLVLGGVHSTTNNNLIDDSASYFKTSNEGAIIKIDYTNQFNLSESYANTNRQLLKTEDANYVSYINFPYAYSSSTNTWTRDNRDLIMNYRANGDVYSHILLMPGTSSNIATGDVLTLKNIASSDIYIYYLEFGIHGFDNLTSGDFIFARLITYSNSGSDIGSNRRNNNISLNDCTDDDRANIVTNNKIGSTGTEYGCVLGGWLSQNFQIKEDNDMSKELIKLSQNHGIALQLQKNGDDANTISIDFNAYIRIKYIRTNDNI